MDRNKFNNRKKIHMWVRAEIQIVFFFLMPSIYTSAFAGVKYIFTQIGAGEKIQFTSFLSVLVVLCLYTAVFGRFFCGFACAFGSLGDFFRFSYTEICKKMHKKPFRMSEKLTEKLVYVKYGVLIFIGISCFLGIFSKTQGMSPWDVFSMLHAGNFRLGGYTAGLVILLLIVAGMCLEERFFCRFLCPMGAVFTLIPILPFFFLRRDREQCLTGCKAGARKCPSGIEVPDKHKLELEGDCFHCQKCVDICPKQNISTGIKGLKSTEVWFTVLRAALLFGIFKWMGL